MAGIVALFAIGVGLFLLLGRSESERVEEGTGEVPGVAGPQDPQVPGQATEESPSSDGGVPSATALRVSEREASPRILPTEPGEDLSTSPAVSGPPPNLPIPPEILEDFRRATAPISDQDRERVERGTEPIPANIRQVFESADSGAIPPEILKDFENPYPTWSAGDPLEAGEQNEGAQPR